MAIAEEQDWLEEHRRELTRRSKEAAEKALREAQAAASEALESIPDPQMRVLVRLLADLMGRDQSGQINAWRADWHVVEVAALLKSARDAASGS
ncbi:MAG: hypothetical protein KF889_05250 [Alphaproteobacteria bacterium]|nr:hypothetical protein [Alphaproteobacteria bacterium]MCW5742276.1 hypothetical protein [Alphaproteobacteria bacterium]